MSSTAKEVKVDATSPVHEKRIRKRSRSLRLSTLDKINDEDKYKDKTEIVMMYKDVIKRNEKRSSGAKEGKRISEALRESSGNEKAKRVKVEEENHSKSISGDSQESQKDNSFSLSQSSTSTMNEAEMKTNIDEKKIGEDDEKSEKMKSVEEKPHSEINPNEATQEEYMNVVSIIRSYSKSAISTPELFQILFKSVGIGSRVEKIIKALANMYMKNVKDEVKEVPEPDSLDN